MLKSESSSRHSSKERSLSYSEICFPHNLVDNKIWKISLSMAFQTKTNWVDKVIDAAVCQRCVMQSSN